MEPNRRSVRESIDRLRSAAADAALGRDVAGMAEPAALPEINALALLAIAEALAFIAVGGEHKEGLPNEGAASDGAPELGETGSDSTAATHPRDGADSHDVGHGSPEAAPADEEGGGVGSSGATAPLEPCPLDRTDYEACFAPFRYCPVKGCGRAEDGQRLPVATS